ncbi:hypothetical protein ACIGMX_34610 [Streptomyces aquilus]|uniref:hypothetical protein n=1 Tax=Streptomyces aquilus TaxID=2548456 RepID=UPI0037D5B03C
MTLDATSRFTWRRRDDSGWHWGNAHALNGPCTGCTSNYPAGCPNCGGRLHREPIADNGLTYSYCCQGERTDENGGALRVRSAPSRAEAAAKAEMLERERRQRADRLLDRVLGGVLTVKVALAVVFVAAIVVGLLIDV